MDPEYLSDGFLFESRDDWRNAFLNAPEDALCNLVERCRSLEETFTKLDPTATFTAIDDLILACRSKLKALIAALPKRASLFPNETERKSTALPVCRFLSDIEPLQREEWELLCSLSEQGEKESLLYGQLTDLASALPAALSGAKGLDVFPRLEREHLATKNLKDRMEKASAQEQARKEVLTKLHKTFFCDFVSALSSAADLENESKEASPAKLLRLCGEAEGFLVSLS